MSGGYCHEHGFQGTGRNCAQCGFQLAAQLEPCAGCGKARHLSTDRYCRECGWCWPTLRA